MTTIHVTVGSSGGTVVTGSLVDAPDDPGDLNTRIYAVNCGGAAVSDWASDAPYANASTVTYEHDPSLSIDLTGVTDPAPEAVYRSERYAPTGINAVALSFPVQAETHKIRVHLAENWPASMTVGGRVHSVVAQAGESDREAVEGVDVFALAGSGNKAYIIELIHTMPPDHAGVLTVLVERGTGDHPRLQGVEVYATDPLDVTASAIVSVTAVATPAGSVPEPGDWGEFPTILNAGWADWNLDNVPFDAQVVYTPPPALPTLPNVPANAVAVTPSTIASAVNSNPAGTNFSLAAGTYFMTLPTKAGNRYYGNRDNWGAVIIHGQNSRQLAVGRGVNNVELYYMTVQNFLGFNPEGSWNSSGAIDPGGNNWRLCGIVLRWNHYAGLRASGSGGRVEFVRAYQNGQYGFCGPASGWVFDCIEVYENGEQAYLPPGIPEYSSSDRGASKFGQNYNLDGTSGGRITARRWHSYRNYLDGIWFDIRIEDIIVEYCWFEDLPRFGVNLESGRPNGRPIVVRFNLFDNVAYQTVNAEWWRYWYIALPAAIRFSMCNNVETYCNKIINSPRGIGGYQWNHPQYSGSTTTPGAGTVNASPVYNCYTHHNYVALGGGGSNPSNVGGGITELSSLGASCYAAAANNRWRDNVYTNPSAWNWNWSPNSSARTWAQWQAAGQDQ